MDLRLKVNQLDNEARARHRQESVREFAPPFEIKLDTARQEAIKAMAFLERPPLSEDPAWSKLHNDLKSISK